MWARIPAWSIGLAALLLVNLIGRAALARSPPSGSRPDSANPNNVPLPTDDAKDREITSKTFPALKLVRIPAKGKQFTMGAPKGEPGQLRDETEHQVTLTADFYLAVVPVTRGQFAAFVKETGYVTDPEKGGRGLGWDPVKRFVEGGKFNWRNPGFEQTDEHPVVKTSWNDAMAFCKWLGGKDGREYRLPTEAQWEFACRAGTKTRYSFGDNDEEILKYANVADAETQRRRVRQFAERHILGPPMNLSEMLNRWFAWIVHPEASP